MKFGLALASQHAAGDDLVVRWKEQLEQDTVVEQCAFYQRCCEELGKRYIAGKYQSYHEWGQDDAMPDDETFVLEAEELAKDRFVVGDPAAVRDEIARYRERLSLDAMAFRLQWSGMDNEQVLRSIRLLGEEVLPHL